MTSTLEDDISRLDESWTWKIASAFLSEESRYNEELDSFLKQFQCSDAADEGSEAPEPEGLWRDWTSGGGLSGSGANITGSIWAMPLEERQARLCSWQQQRAQSLCNGLARDMEAYIAHGEELQLLREEAKVHAAARAKILGCTTTSAAKNREILAQLRPTVVIVEEACEILEASLLTCLGPSVKHLIMIGDHKQLRPKLQCYQLRKESGHNFDFDVSLFERLAVSGFPTIILNEQRRMRPEICDLIRLTTYPELKDHQSVLDREPARGVSSSVIFIDHNHLDGSFAENVMLDTSSKVNKHEVGMVREIVRYFLRQSYQAADVVVLTPYLGQLALIREELKKIKIVVDVNELDSQELQRADMATSAAEARMESRTGGASLGSLGVRVATVDNFQGEEAKIIIGSLVRCNDRAEVGFVAGAERAIVLLSRARDAFVLLGSADTLCKARRCQREGTADWPRIIDHLRSRGQVFSGFPAVCAQHAHCPSEQIDIPEKFKVHLPCGGCTRICGLPLLSCPHGHPCASFCHPIADPVNGNDVHHTMQCRVIVQELCKNGHDVARECCNTASKCSVTVSAKCPTGLHSTERLCFEAPPTSCLACGAAATQKADEAQRLAQEAAKQSEAITREREELAAINTELHRAEQENLFMMEMEQLQSKKRLALQELSKAKKARTEILASTPSATTSSPAIPGSLIPTRSSSVVANDRHGKKTSRTDFSVMTTPPPPSTTSRDPATVTDRVTRTPAVPVSDDTQDLREVKKPRRVERSTAPAPSSTSTGRVVLAGASPSAAVVVSGEESTSKSPAFVDEGSTTNTSKETNSPEDPQPALSTPAVSTSRSAQGRHYLEFSFRSFLTVFPSWPWINSGSAPALVPSTLGIGAGAGGGDPSDSGDNATVDQPVKVPKTPAKVKRAARTSKSAAQDRLQDVLKLADGESWADLTSLPELPAPSAKASHSEHFSHLAVQAVHMLAGERDGSAATGAQAIEPLVERFNKLNDSCETGCVDNVLVYLVSAVLQFVRFALFSKVPDLQQSAKKNAGAFVRLLQGNARQALFQQLPKAWKAVASMFNPGTEPATSLLTQTPEQKTLDWNCAEERWKFCRKKFLANVGAKNTSSEISPRTTPAESIDILLKMTGMESVKRSIIGMYERLQIAKLQGGAEVGTTFNLRCDGNPGTGKTTVARLFASFLVEVGILPKEADIHETSGSKLISDGVKGLTKILEDMKVSGGGGVVFVDETYQLNPMPGSPGGQVLDFILPLAEKMDGPYGKIVWIFSGYTSRMDKLFEHNPGLPSRFPHRLLFEDYTDAELLSIMNSLMQNGGRDIGTPPPKKTPAPAAPKPKRLPAPVPAGSANGGYDINGTPKLNGGYNSYGSLVFKPDQKDQWGNTWSYNRTTAVWEDEFNNISGTGATSLGTATNPLISRNDNSPWHFNDAEKHWCRADAPEITQTWYPGSPAPPPPPIPVVPIKPFVADPKWVRVAITRLGRSRGKVGFGNARAVRILFEQTHTRQTMRLSALERQNLTAFKASNKMEFLRDDLLGPKADAESLKNSCAAWQKLQAMPGLREVKESLEKLVELAVINSDLEDEEQPVRGVVLNRIFLGNPGTGKTTVAALYGQILCHLGLLSKGELVLKNSSDFVGVALGGSESQTRNILAASEGCVLVIDEAYSLNPSPSNKGGGGLSGMDPFKTAVVDTIVEQVQGRPGEDRAVVMLGYRKEMEDFLAKANPGLSRRFQMENAFEFADYDDHQLLKILVMMCSDEGLSICTRVATYAVKQLARARSLPNFGNAGALNNLLSVAKLNMGNRRELEEADFHVGGVVPVKTEESMIFDDLVGCDNVLAELRSMQSSIKFAQKRGKDIKSTFESSFLFVGGPGTGKTTVARKMGVMFHSLGLLPTPDVMEIKAADLATGFVGQSAHKATEVINRAKGKVLFIDEAYQLNPAKGGQFMQEAADALVKALTSEELQGQLVVILAGYEKEIDDMLRATNPGLRSRFSKKIVFEDFTPEHVESILRADLAAENMTLSVDADEQLCYVAEDLCDIHEFSNGRDAKTLVKRIMKCYAERVMDEEDEPDLLLEDVHAALETMQKSRLRGAKTAASGPQHPPALVPPPQLQYQSQFAPPPPPVVTEVIKEVAVEQEEDVEVEEGMEVTEEVQEANGGFASGSTQFLRTLQSLLDQEGLNSQAGVRRLARMGLNDPYMQQLAHKIAGLTGTDVSGAQELLREWQKKQGDVEDKVAEMEKEKALAKQEKRKALLPIWRCAVCGRADMPYIVCYVSPYICEYREVDV